MLGTPSEYFTLEVIASTFVKDGAIVEGFHCRGTWFDRGAEKQQLTANIITKHVAEMGYPEVDTFLCLLSVASTTKMGLH